LQLVREPSNGVSIWLVGLGIIISFITGIIVIKWLLDYLKKHSLLVFVLYRFVIGASVIALWLIRR
jgi:undecaprenyl-diphosphatase